MKFSEKLRKKRKEMKMNQEELASLLGVTKRTVQNYEISNMHPKKRDIYYRLAEIFSVDVNYFLTEGEEILLDVYEKGGNYAVREVDELIRNICGLFSGGKIPEADMDAAMRAISEAYFAVKAENKKYLQNNQQ